ncbi:hypothetical protein BDFB_014464 [Asbolus verrucosus]|uniref:Uncharacterized protein n=1 Tax=Asbolus verrucosus TaxID=1661398 RepID=A0A482V7S5_ASBVE|nr:hypothetical protein BDFB_014464 [Asbolus verrucosus]
MTGHMFFLQTIQGFVFLDMTVGNEYGGD